MSSSDHNSTIATLLNSLEEALDEGNPSDVLAFLRVLRMNGVDDQTSADLVAIFSDSPQADDFDDTRQWIAHHRQRIAPATDDGPSAGSDSLIDIEIDDELSDFDDFGDFDELSAVDEVDEVNPFDDFDGFGDIGDFDDIGDFGDLSMDDEDASSDETHKQGQGPSGGDISQTPFASGHTPAPSPTTGQMPASTATDDEVSTAITGEREMTRQLGREHLQALSEASGATSGDAASVFDHPTRREFQASPPPNDETAEPSPNDDMPAPTREAFNFDYDSTSDSGPHDSVAESDAGSGDEHFEPGELPPPLTEESSSSPESSEEMDFDFDLGPTSAPSSSESAFDQPPTTNPGDGDDPMGYAPPPTDDDAFFPPPLSNGDADSSHVESNTPAPFPESPSVSNALPHSDREPQDTTDAPKQTPQRDVQKTPLASQSQIQGSEAQPPSEGDKMDSAPLNEDELLALGEELSTGDMGPPKKSTTLPGPPSRTSSQAGSYRGEPMLPDNSSPKSLGNEPTPAHESPSPLNAPGFSHPNEPTNKFDRQDPDVEEAYKTPSGADRSAPQPLTESSSFYLEEVQDAPASAPSSPTSSDDAGSGDDVTIEDAVNRARALYEQGEFQTSMELVEAILELEDHSDAQELQRLLEGELERMQANRLGSLALTPCLEISMGEMAQLDLDHRAGFLLSQVDGMLTFEDILDMSSMSRLETLTVLADLYEEDIIGID